MARIGKIEFVLISEERTFSNEITSHPVESGAEVSDHVINQPMTYQIEGEYTGRDAPSKHAELVKLYREGKPVYYSGRAAMWNAVIESFSSTVDQNIANGFRFSMTIKHIRIAEPSAVAMLPAKLRAEVADKKNKGRKKVS